MLVLLFLIFSRTTDQLASTVGSGVYVIRTLSAVLFVLTLMSGGMRRALFSWPGLLLTAFTFWMLLSTPFSVWPGGSMGMLVKVWFKSLLFYTFVAGLVVTAEQCRRAMYSIALGTAFITVIAFFVGSVESGRLTLSVGTFRNANDLALFMLLGVPPSLLMITSPQSSRVARGLGSLAVVLLLIRTFQTGSRAGLVITLVLLLIVLAYVPVRWKLVLSAGAGVLAIFAVVLTSRGALDRYRQLVPGSADDDEVPSEQTEMAESSTRARMTLMKASLALTLEHPLFGVGPGMFQVAAAEDELARYPGAAWHETHNSYTQVSSETGLPGFFLYCGVLFYCFTTSLRLYHVVRRQPGLSHLSSILHCLFLMDVVFALGCLFGSIAYEFFLPILAALTLAFEIVVKREAAYRSDSAAEATQSRQLGRRTLQAASESRNRVSLSRRPNRPRRE